MEKGETRRSYSSCEHGRKGFLRSSSICLIRWDQTKQVLEEPIWGHQTRASVHVRREPGHFPVRPAREVLKRHGVTEICPELTPLGRGAGLKDLNHVNLSPR
jgi:hypothetical protein